MTLLTNRHEAGKLLAAELQKLNLGQDICVLALPRGGVPVAWEIAHLLACPLDMLFVKKIGAPGFEEFALGAVSENSFVVWQLRNIEVLDISPRELDQLMRSKETELQAQLKAWRVDRPAIDVRNKTTIVVDDGLATGTTMTVALQFLKTKQPKQILVAAPVASHSAVRAIEGYCDKTLILHQPEPFSGVGQWYKDFTQVTDREVERLMSDIQA